MELGGSATGCRGSTKGQEADRLGPGIGYFGSDIDARLVEIAKKNAQAAGVEADIHFKQMLPQDLKTDKTNGVIISNPPYGERNKLDDEAIVTLYREMGQTFAPLGNLVQVHLDQR